MQRGKQRVDNLLFLFYILLVYIAKIKYIIEVGTQDNNFAND